MAVQPCLCRTWLETPKTGFLTTRLKLSNRLPVELLEKVSGFPKHIHFKWSHFLNRLIEDEERQWTDENIDMVALKHFPGINREEAVGRPILFSNWLSKDYTPVDRERLREYTKARLKVCIVP